MSDNGKTSDRWGLRLQIWAAVLLGLASLATAWAGYQSTRWGGAMTIQFTDAIIKSTDASKFYQQANAQLTFDGTLFIEYSTLIDQGQVELANELRESLFSPELETVVAKYEEKQAAARGQGEADAGPFDEYRSPDFEAAEELEEMTDGLFKDAKQANQTGDNYVLLTVIFASVLFMAGVATAFRNTRVRLVILSFGSVFLVGCAAIMATCPVR